MLNLELARVLTTTNLRARYRTTVLGFWWDAALPLCFALVYAGAFRALSVRPPPGAWPAYLLGVGSFHWTAAVIVASGGLYARSGSLLRRMPVHFAEHAVACVLSEAAPFAVVLLISTAASLPGPSAVAALVFLALAQTAALAGWTALAASAGAIARDVSRLASSGSRLLFFATPVAFDPAVLSPALQGLLRWNPAAVFVEAWRAALSGTLEPSLLPWVFLHAAVGLALLALVERLAAPRLAEYA